jgi:hypothetical protein
VAQEAKMLAHNHKTRHSVFFTAVFGCLLTSELPQYTIAMALAAS